MHAVIIGGGMGGLFAALALREAEGVFDSIDVYEQTRTPTTAGAGLNISPNGARLCHWLGVDLDGGDPKGPDGVPDGGRAAILEASREILANGSVSRKPIPYNTPEQLSQGGGFHHMHRQDLLMCLHKRVSELGPESGVKCPVRVHMGKRLTKLSQDESRATAVFEDGTTVTADLVIGADGIGSKVLKETWPGRGQRRWTDVVCYRGLIPRDKVAALRKPDGSPLDHNPIDSYSMDTRRHDTAWVMTYWVRGGELLNVWYGVYTPDSGEFPEDWAGWKPIENADILETTERAFAGDPRKDDILAIGAAMVEPTKWGLYDRDALEDWQEGRICLLGDAAHPMLPTFGQGVNQTLEDGAALSSCFKLHGHDVYSALLHYERVRHYRASRFQFASKFNFKVLEPEDTPERKALLAAANERDFPLFAHEQRAGNDDAWIYDFDARNVGDTLPRKKLGPWDFRDREVIASARREVMRNLWKPQNPSTGDREVTRDELAGHNTFDDCWIVIGGKVYDFSEWKDHHPGGAFVARMYAGRDATAEFSDFHSKAALKHMDNFCVGRFVD